MENAFPASSTNSLPIHSRSRSIGSLSIRDRSSIPTNATTTPKSVPHTRQQRLLQTRHARFSAQRLSVNTITFPQLIRSSENDSPHFSSPRYIKQDESHSPSDMTSDLTSSSPASTILNEIANFAASRKHSHQSRPPIPIFKDSSDRFSATAVHRSSSNEPPAFSTDSVESASTDMGLREVSVNLQRSSPVLAGSPHYASIRSSVRRRTSQAKHRFNSEEYIQHIENELQMVKDAMYSPNTHLPWKEKLKKARQENEQLKKELEVQQSSFELELRNTVERLTENELRLKRKVRDLEESAEQKNATIKELEFNREESRLDQGAVDALRARIDKLEEERMSLEVTNRGMTKRNEVLTQLLALSPTKSQHGIELPTPRRRNGRPMSLIIPRMPSSPVQFTPLSRPQSIVMSPGNTEPGYFTRYNLSSPVISSPGFHRPTYSETNDDIRSIDSGLGESCVQSTNPAASRRSTLASHVSSSPELPPSFHPPHDSRPPLHVRQPSKRRPRKFIPGSTQLKPLLLPTFTADNGNLPSASPLTSPQRTADATDSNPLHASDPGKPASRSGESSQEIPTSPPSCPDYLISEPGPSFQSLNEVFAKLGESTEPTLMPEPPGSDSRRGHGELPTKDSENSYMHSEFGRKPPRPRITSWVLKTVPTPPSGADIIYDHGHPSIDQGAFYKGFGPVGTSQSGHSLRDSEPEISPVEIPRPLFSRAVSRSLDEAYLEGRSHLEESPLNPRKRRKGSKTDVRLSPDQSNVHKPSLKDTDAPNTRPVLNPKSLRDRAICDSQTQRRSSNRMKTGSANVLSPLELLQQRGIGSKPLAAITIQTVYATLSRYTSYIQTFKQDPLALARRVIANAWRSNWAVFGKMSWWVLGLFISRRRSSTSNDEWDWDVYDGESIAQKFCSDYNDIEDSDYGTDRQQEDAVRHGSDFCQSHNTVQNQTKQKLPPEGVKSGWGNSLLLWGKFSVAIMLAVGGAIVRGPGEMLRDTEDRRHSRSSSIEKRHKRLSAKLPHLDHTAGTLLDRFKAARLSPQCHDLEPNTIRKVRSFSSPTPSCGYHEANVTFARSHIAIGPSGYPSDTQDTSVAVEPSVKRSDVYDPVSLTNDDTLKPRRTERKGIEAFFQDSPGVILNNTTEIHATMKRYANQGSNTINNASHFSDYG
ncbi:hypothetical protein LTR84_011539 [Exophiala bonariae]|uniref:Uncharacterized protein n=1 Tax=Exophiala bonariae TaxID=1690606 RepID=A0AAV9NGR0_9EURO|nr:hypothetical protein LTR84_011539 [Exophiala bonariae]